jgi:hypothetical protein
VMMCALSRFSAKNVPLMARLFASLPPLVNTISSADTSPLLTYIAIVLALLLALLEIDAHRVELESLGLLPNNYPVPAILLGP